MGKLVEIIRRKPFLFVLISLAYLLVVGLLKWRFKPPLTTLLFLGGGAIGIYFLDISEVFFNLSPSPFRSALFMGLFAAVSFFVVTSSGSLLGSGLVLSIYLTLILWQIGEWQMAGNLNSWYRQVEGLVAPSIQRWGLIFFLFLFLIETALFLR